MRLTDAAIARLRPRERETADWDSRVPGLGFRVRPAGARTLVMLRDVGGGSRRVSLGPVSTMGIRGDLGWLDGLAAGLGCILAQAGAGDARAVRG